MTYKKALVLGAVLLLLAVVGAACKPKATPTPVPTATAVPTPPPVPISDIPNYEAWAASGHADAKAEAFNHWNDPAANPDGVPAACAQCHTSNGLANFLHGQAANVAIPGGVINCKTCHNDATFALTSVTFPGT